MTLEEIYDQHADFVLRTLRRLGVPSTDLSDAAQEVFLTVHRSLGTFEGRCAVTTWLFTICRSTARDRRQRAHQRYEVGNDAALEAQADFSADTDAQAQRNQMAALLDALLAQLHEDQREVFVLFEVEGFTGEEVAQAVGAPLATVYSRLRLARQAFRDALSRRQTRDRFTQQRVGGAS